MNPPFFLRVRLLEPSSRPNTTDYMIYEINVEGLLWCNGHAQTEVKPSPDDLLEFPPCICEHNTSGKS